MGLVFGTPLKCGHYESDSYSDFDFDLKWRWNEILNKLSVLDSNEDFRKYSLAELKKGHKKAEIMQSELKDKFNELLSEHGNFEEAREVKTEMDHVQGLIEDSTNLIGKFFLWSTM